MGLFGIFSKWFHTGTSQPPAQPPPDPNAAAKGTVPASTAWQPPSAAPSAAAAGGPQKPDNFSAAGHVASAPVTAGPGKNPGLPRALEDLPEDAREQYKMLTSTPNGAGFGRKIFDVVENDVLSIYGHLETTKLLGFLKNYPVTNYTYPVSDEVSRGDRPDPQKLKALAAQGYTMTVNLCAELPDGDAPNIAAAGLTGKMQTLHFPIVDMTQPLPDDSQPAGQMPNEVVQFLNAVTAPGQKVYVHCEAGKARTGIMIACYRMAVQGWSAQDALAEAQRFGCSVPMQQKFIQDFGAALVQHAANPSVHPELGKYPLVPPGSVHPTPAQAAATLQSAAAVSK